MGDMQAPRSPEDVRAFFTAWIESNNGGDWDRVAQLVHPHVVLLDPMTPEPARGRAATVLRAKAQYEPFPDGRVEMIGDAFVSLAGDELAYRWRFVGTHLRPVHPPGFAPTGRRVGIEGT
jgi:ketosteroid isomerase-like protein